MTFTNPGYLVSTAWLADHLKDADVRVLDCTVYLRPPAPDAPRQSYVQESGLANWDVRRYRRAVQHMEMLSPAFPELWQNVEFMKRIDAIAAVGDRSTPVMGN